MIILTDQQKEFLENFLIPFRELMNQRGADVVPIPLKNGYMLPEDLLSAKEFTEIKEALLNGGHLNNITIREVTQEELIEYEL